jgi:hypothetical protein
LFLFSVLLPLRSYFVEGCALSRKGRKEKIRKDHIKALDKGDLVLIIFALYYGPHHVRPKQILFLTYAC